MTVSENIPWKEGKCRVPMWVAVSPAGFCEKDAFGPQYPRQYLASENPRYLIDRPPYCVGHCCPSHGGPKAGDPIIFQDGLTDQGRPMYCAVMPDFVDLQVSPAGFDGNPLVAVKNLRSALSQGTQP